MFGFASVVWPVEEGGACFTTGRRGGLADTGEGEAVVSRAGTTATRGVVSARALVSTALPPPRNASAAAAPPRTTTAAATLGTSRRFRRGWLGREALDHRVLHRGSLERQLAGEHLEEHEGERVQVAAAVDGVPRQLLGAHELGRTDHQPRFRHLLVVAAAHRLGDPEIDH